MRGKLAPSRCWTLTSSFSTTFKAIVGTGILALPYALAGTGLILGGVFLLLSALWPVVTFWGARSLRRIGPWVSFYDRTQRYLGLLRSWAWMGVMVKFATTFANGPVSVRLHRHLTQSAMVLYIFHRLSEQLWLTAVKRHIGVELDRMGLCWLLICCNFLTCLLLYAGLSANRHTAKMFGIDSV